VGARVKMLAMAVAEFMQGETAYHGTLRGPNLLNWCPADLAHPHTHRPTCYASQSRGPACRIDDVRRTSTSQGSICPCGLWHDGSYPRAYPRGRKASVYPTTPSRVASRKPSISSPQDRESLCTGRIIDDPAQLLLIL